MTARPAKKWQEIADDLRDKISSGELAPGDKLPSENDLIDQWGHSRIVVRQAIQALAAEGLVTVSRGKRPVVRDTATGASGTTGLDRTIHQADSAGLYTADGDLTEAETPSRYRTRTDAVTGPPLDLDQDEAAFGTDRLMTHEPTGARVLHRSVIPFATADGTTLESDPHRPQVEVYAALTAAGHELSWSEQVTARMPTPDEASTLGMDSGVPLLVIRRITHGTSGPLVYEETRAAADALHVVYRLTAEPTARQTTV